MIHNVKLERPVKLSLPQLTIFFCMIVFTWCIGTSVAPLQRLTSPPVLAVLPTNRFLAAWGAWLPTDFHLVSNAQTSQVSTNNLEFFLFITLAFVMYGISAGIIRYRLKEAKNTGIWSLLWAGTALVGLIFVFTPAMLSHDIFVYADYGHTIVVHGSNPYFVPPAAISHDVLTQLDDWRMYIAAYGPLWLSICSFLAWQLGNVPWQYIFAFRLLGLAAHTLNIFLIMLILRRAGCSRRTILSGTWLYAWNPLLLLESSFGAHNDILMAAFLLLGILLCMQAEQKGFTRPANYLPPIIAFTLSALIKFTMLPLIIFFLLLLARKTLYIQSTDITRHQRATMLHWRSTCINVFLASLLSGFTILSFYTPFWIGHTASEIGRSFSSPPSAFYSENSISRVIYEWIRQHGLPASTSWAYLPMHILSKHIVWNELSLAVLGVTMVIGAVCLWRIPTTQTLILATLSCLGALLIVTPWFYPWYIIWLIALAGASFSLPNNSLRRALVGFALIFSFTSLLTYISNTIALAGEWAVLVQYLLIAGLPLLVFVLLATVKNVPLCRTSGEDV